MRSDAKAVQGHLRTIIVHVGGVDFDRGNQATSEGKGNEKGGVRVRAIVRRNRL